MNNAIKGSAKALIAALIGAGAVWVTRRYGIDVPPEMQNTLADALVALVGGVATGAMTWLVPNKTA